MAVVDSPKLRRIRVVYEIEIELDAPSRGGVLMSPYT
jgi:hypothetical protein